MEYEVEGPRPRGRPKRTWREVVREDCQARKMNKEDAIDRCKWRKMKKDVWWSGWVWVGECFFWYWPTQVVPDPRPLNGSVCVCVCVRACVRACVCYILYCIVHENTSVFSATSYSESWHCPYSPATCCTAVHCAAVYQYLLLWDRQTEWLTDAWQVHRPCSAYYAGRVSISVSEI